MSKHSGILILSTCIGGLVACTSARDNATNAKAEYVQEETETLKDY